MQIRVNGKEPALLAGAMLLRVWSNHPYRATRDLDLLRRGDGSAEAIRCDVEAICATPVDMDGLRFDVASMKLEPVRAEDEYAGTRIVMRAFCGNARITMQIDIGWEMPLIRPQRSSNTRRCAPCLGLK